MTDEATFEEPSKFPEHEKLKTIKADVETVTSFLEWLQDREWWFADQGGWGECVGMDVESVIAEYFEIDRERLSREKDQMVKEYREKHGL